MRIWPVAAMVLVACAPPDPVGLADTGVEVTEPSLAFVHPPPGQTFEAELDDDCFMRVLIAVDVDDFALIEPESQPPSDREGHLHIAWGTGAYNPVSEAAFLLEVDAVAENLTTNAIRNLRVSLQANDHADLDQYENWDATVEYTLTDPSGNCSL